MLKVTLQVHSVCFIRNKIGVDILTLIVFNLKQEKIPRKQPIFFYIQNLSGNGFRCKRKCWSGDFFHVLHPKFLMLES